MRKLAWTFRALNAGDVLTTLTALRLGWGEEANPAMAWLLRMGWPAFVVFKVIWAEILLWSIGRRWGSVMRTTLTVICWLFTVVVLNNTLGLVLTWLRG